ncbi:MAG: hypothetical protein KDK99_17965 [Verrucomicrobiales bacterium]|nr:hypothetical protein [Verrucomicrobiales bacterium]
MDLPFQSSRSELLQQLEQLSMHLDATSDALAQTRDWMNRQLSHQAHQMDVMRQALHAAASTLVATLPPESIPPLSAATASAGMPRDYHLENLFAAPSAQGSIPTTAEGAISLPPAPGSGLPSAPSENLPADALSQQQVDHLLFEQAPSAANSASQARGWQDESASALSAFTLEPSAADLEQATLEELNEALARAFAQMSGRVSTMV